ncbi:MAG: hypothetical protein ABI597_03570 [Gammaproteobacteria bacterium]
MSLTRDQILKFNATQLEFFTFLNTSLAKIISAYNLTDENATKAAALKLKVDTYQTSIELATEESLTQKFVNDLVLQGNALVSEMTALSSKVKSDETNGNMSCPTVDVVSTRYDIFKASEQDVQSLTTFKNLIIQEINEKSLLIANKIGIVNGTLPENISAVKDQLDMLAPIKNDFDAKLAAQKAADDLAKLAAKRAADDLAKLATQKAAANQAQNAYRTFSPKKSAPTAPVVKEHGASSIAKKLMGFCKI